MKSSYAVVCNGSSTGEEFILVFRVNQAPERGQTGVQVQPTNRVILSPFAAKRLAALLTNAIREYEARFGPLILNTGGHGECPESRPTPHPM